MIWGIHPVLEVLQTCPQSIREITVEKEKPGRRLEELVDLAQKKGVPVHMVAGGGKTGQRKSARFPESENTQGVFARVGLPFLTLDGLLHALNHIDVPPLLLALDSIQDPHNLGAIIRSAVAAGVHGIIVPKDRSAPITGTVIKTSAGSVFHVDICRVTNLVSTIKVLKEKGIWIFGTAKDAPQSVYDADLTVPACLVVGGEEKGLRPLVAGQCDLMLSIPMPGKLDSLNASVAAGVVLFETVRQRRARSV